MSILTFISCIINGNKRRYRNFIILGIMCSALSAGEQEESSSNEAKGFTFGFEADVVSAYLWHGLEVTRTPVGHPWLWVSASGFTMSAWGTKDFAGDDYDDAELILEYEAEWGDVMVMPTLEWYFYPTAVNSGELTIKVKYAFLGRSGLYTKQSIFLWGVPGDYAGEIGFAFEREFSDVCSMEAETGFIWASASFNDNNCDVAKWALDVWNTEIAVTWYPLKFLYLCPHAGAAVVLDRELQRSTVALPFAGLTVGVEL